MQAGEEMLANPYLAIYAVAFLFVGLFYLVLRRKQEGKNLDVRSAAIQAGLTEPASLHPKIDPRICKGCGACVHACPEGRILGLVNGRAELIEPTQCIGHGACASACPFEAISLVFGTEKRGVAIPQVGPDFQTNVPGIFIAGELGGMGLIRNAVEQGRQAMETIARQSSGRRPDMLDVVIVGAGPAGFAASLGAMEKNLNFVTIEQDTLGGTVSHYPRGKLVMTQPATLPLIGKMKFRETSKEELLEFWTDVERKTGLQVKYQERLEAIERRPDGFTVVTTRGRYATRSVLLCIGRRGTPRKLGAAGEDSAKVVYRLIDPEQYRGTNVLVVGGGDSALEAAASIAEEPRTSVALAYRGEAFSRAKPKNRERVEVAEANGGLRVFFRTNVKQISERTVVLDRDGKLETLPNDAVIICAGGILPTGLLKDIGIEVETKYGTA